MAIIVPDIPSLRLISLSSPPTTTNAGSDTTLTFASQITQGIVQNNTSANANINFTAAASAGTLLVPPGFAYEFQLQTTTLHLFTAAAQNVNGSTAGNIVVLGRA